MSSLFEELSEKIRQAPSTSRRNAARQDLSILVFAERDSIDALWKAAERVAGRGGEGLEDLSAAVSKLRPVFGERSR